MVRSPVEICRGTSPSQAAKSRPLENTSPLPIAATMALEMIGPMPGTVPCCFEALWDEDTKAWHLLLEDLTDSHVIATTWPLPPTFEQCESILRARARFHAAWWDDLRLGASVGNWLDTGGMDHYLQKFAQQFTRFVDRVGDLLPRKRRDLYELLLGAAPR